MSACSRGLQGGGIKSVKDIASGTVATELPNIARAYFAKRGISPDIAEVLGMTELTPHVDISDAIIDITSVDRHSRGTASLSSTWCSNRRYVCSHTDHLEDVWVQ